MQVSTRNKGFTLLELLVVIAIIGILAAVLIPNLISARNTANEKASQMYIRNVANGVEINRTSETGLPPAGTTCIQLTENPQLPGSVENCWYVPGTGTATDTYKVTVKSENGKYFQYNGKQIVTLASYP